MANYTVQITQRKVNNTVAPGTKSLSSANVLNAKTIPLVGSATRVTTTATVVTSEKHGFVVGDSVVITGAAPFAKTATIATVKNAYTFTYAVTNSGATSATIKCLVTQVLFNNHLGMGATPVKYQITRTLAAFAALLPAAQWASLNIIGDATMMSDKYSTVAAAQPVVWPLKTVESFFGVDGATQTASNIDRALTVVTVTSVAHGLQSGQYIVMDGSNNALDGTYAITVVDADTFTYTSGTSGTITAATGTFYVQTTNVTVYEETAVAKQYVVNEAYATVVAAFAY